ncbi:hypothetical protein PISMIDRAFT_683205, partial [Pisolithus microcarpus 441]
MPSGEFEARVAATLVGCASTVPDCGPIVVFIAANVRKKARSVREDPHLTWNMIFCKRWS